MNNNVNTYGGQSPFQAPNAAATAVAEKTEEVSQVQPFIRFFARFLDYILYGTILQAVLTIIGIDIYAWAVYDRFIDIIWSICITFTWIFFEAFFLSRYGKTLGKHLIKTKVVDSEGHLLSYRAALERSFDVFLLGMCGGIPVLEWVTMSFGYYKLKRDGITVWDKRGGFHVVHTKFNPAFVYVIVCLYVLVLMYYGLRALSAYMRLGY